MSISENKKVKKIDDGIVIIVDVGREKCTVESSVYEDRKVNIHRNQYYSKDGLSRGIKNLIKKGYVNKKEAINVDKLVFDALLEYDKKYGTKFKNKYLLVEAKEKKWFKETRQEYKQRCVESRNSILAYNNMKIEYDTTNTEDPSKLIKNRKLKYASRFIKQYKNIEKNTMGTYLKLKQGLFYRLIEKIKKPKLGKLLEDMVEKYDEQIERQEDMYKEHTKDGTDISKVNKDEIQPKETLMEMIEEVKENQKESIENEIIKKEEAKLSEKNQENETLMGMIQKVKGNQKESIENEIIKEEEAKSSEKNQENETLMGMIQEVKEKVGNRKENFEEIIPSKKSEEKPQEENNQDIQKEIETTIRKQEELKPLSEEETNMLVDISKSIYNKRNNIFSNVMGKMSNIVDKVNNAIEETKIKRTLKKAKKQEIYKNNQINNTKKLRYVGQAGVLVGLSIFLGLNHHVPTSTNTNKQIEVNKDKENDNLEVNKQNNSNKNDVNIILQLDNKLLHDFTVDKSQNNQKEDSINKEKEDKKENDKKENNKKKEETESNKSKVITAKDVLSTITPGTNLKELTKGKFYASSDGEGPTGSFEKHIKEDKIVEMIKVTFEDGTYKIKNVEDDTNLYKLKKKYPGAEFSCHIKNLGWVNARTVIDAKMKELKKEKNDNKKMVNKGQVVESTNGER